MKSQTIHIFFICLLLVQTLFSQKEKEFRAAKEKPKRFNVGLYVGPLFANKYSASLYDGYGYDFDGNKNNFENSTMYRKIVTENGGINGQTDRIAQQLNVNPGDWTFDESDMPNNMRYNVAFLLGLQTRFKTNKLDAIIFNVNASQINVSGDFTITLNMQSIGTQVPNFENYKTFPITGREQRLMFQLGYQRMIRNSSEEEEEGPFHFFVEGGINVTLAKYDRNIIVVNNLRMDLKTYYNQFGYVDYRVKELTKPGYGIFAGAGVSLNAGNKWTVQLLYNPTYERIGIGFNPKFKLQHSGGMRAYYIL